MRTLVHNIACIFGIDIFGIERQGRTRLCGEEMGRMETLEDAWLLVEDGRIAAFGSASEGMPEDVGRRIDAGGGMLFPSFCDSHTHLVYAGSREQEFLDKINGLSYEEIARRGGGILNSADRLHAASEDELYATAMERVREIAAMGTGCVEIKSGYGLSTAYVKMCRWKSGQPSSGRTRSRGHIADARTNMWASYAGRCCPPWRGRVWPTSSMYSATRASSQSPKPNAS